LIGLMAFVVSSALSGVAPAIGLPITARLLQGVAAGMLVPQESGLIQDLSPGAERGRAFGILGAILRPATAAAPVVGGLILTAFTGPDGWRSVFYVNAPIGLIGLVLATRVLPMRARGRPSAGPLRTRRRKLRLRPPPGGVVDRVVKLSHGERSTSSASSGRTTSSSTRSAGTGSRGVRHGLASRDRSKHRADATPVAVAGVPVW
jgi:MFS family permease